MRNETLAYPAVFHPEKEGGFSITFPDFPEANSQGDTVAQAFEMAIDCLHSVIDWRLAERSEMPSPSRPKKGQYVIPVGLDLAPKVALHRIMRDQNVTNVKLAKKLEVSELVIRRMLNPKHQSKPEQYIRALAALGHVPQVSLIPAKPVVR